MPPTDSPPYPGPAPAALSFPFGPAREALAQIGALATALKTCREAHREAVGDARIDFEGQTRDQFDTAFEDAMTTLDDYISDLESERDTLEDHIADAERAVQARQDAIDQWQSDMSAYRAANPPVPVSGPR